MERQVFRVSIITIISNVLLTVLKLFAGIFAHSSAMISDAVHSLSDVLSTVVVMIGVKMASKEADEDHPYGHERLECVAALLLSIMLFATGAGIGIIGIRNTAMGNKLLVPGGIALVAAIISIIIKEAMYWYTRGVAKKVNSGALLADAWHHRSDSLSSIGSFIGILGARMGYVYLDSIASIIICIFIIKVAIDIFIDSIEKMVDKACDEDVINKIKDVVNNNSKVIEIDHLRTRKFGGMAYVDIDISVDKSISIKEAHDISHKVHLDIEKNVPFVKHCRVHVNPYLKDTIK